MRARRVAPLGLQHVHPLQTHPEPLPAEHLEHARAEGLEQRARGAEGGRRRIRARAAGLVEGHDTEGEVEPAGRDHDGAVEPGGGGGALEERGREARHGGAEARMVSLESRR